jgi:F-type H+-transporting ATPase subunit delta
MADLKNRYAAALFEMSLESGRLDGHMAQAALVLDTLKNDRLESFLVHPHIPNATKHELLQTLFADKISDDLMGFLFLAVKKSREAIIAPALSAYIDMGNRHGQKTVAQVVSAQALGRDQLSALAAVLSKKLGKQVEIRPEVDPALIGGLYIHVDGHLIDRTVRTRLYNLKRELKTRRSQ